jgi:hypothetical protein
MTRTTLDYASPVGSGGQLVRELSVLSVGGCALALIFTFFPYVTTSVSTPFKYELMGVEPADYLRPRQFVLLLSVAVTIAALVVVGRSSRPLRRLNVLALLAQCYALLWIARQWLAELWSMSRG